MLRYSQHILRFTFPLVETAMAFSRASQIGPQRHVAEFNKSLGERMHDFIIERAAKQRVGMSNQRNTAVLLSGIVDHGFQLARRTMNEYLLWSGGMQAAESASNLKARDNASVQQMLFDNFVYIVFVHIGVPHVIRVHHQHWPLIATVHATRRVDADLAFAGEIKRLYFFLSIAAHLA